MEFPSAFFPLFSNGYAFSLKMELQASIFFIAFVLLYVVSSSFHHFRSTHIFDDKLCVHTLCSHHISIYFIRIFMASLYHSQYSIRISIWFVIACDADHMDLRRPILLPTATWCLKRVGKNLRETTSKWTARKKWNMYSISFK